ncbi:carbon-nitrogen hydrolase family protein [Microbacterium sp. zg.Y1090]|uniref:carbon-nitrogen hydrolase family protein n=1 Tax=Microbacterium TaxID=33882 RepID=UPI00214BF41C|nr:MULTISPECIES: carbon-nitrogen hydrolase family protein [unclassified Microbacterium]MCR2812042.1 carbon-nitrogen hydrolase family protein [Microbacterium sp. zg.Y1084]MCR2818519.1 carbon-nitrogen hydrolase family protein [Microbacterium sp. zg.Y1090]MDL5486332.1 carbon-nitrogen hydrolase family protein [Microbacterium sp. zg-Y1211]WIM29527.1 carbon-nitrogen hydrolase family protein [Microbacterium sp. zg-Y1090]
MSEVSIGVAVAQFGPTADPAANLAQIDRLAARARERGAGLVLFPEYSSYFVDPFDDSLAAHAEEVDGAFTSALSAIAARHGLTVAAGMLEKADGGRRVHNTVVAVDADGVRARYRKLHLYDAFGQRESDWVAPGEQGEPQTFTVDGMRFALMTCYDLRFPEVARLLVDAGADAILVAAEWVRGPLKEHHWRTLLTARAIENTVFVAAADHPPPLGVGHSIVIDPQGVQIAGVGTGTDVAVAHVEQAMVARVRRVNPALALRRFRVVPRD